MVVLVSTRPSGWRTVVVVLVTRRPEASTKLDVDTDLDVPLNPLLLMLLKDED